MAEQAQDELVVSLKKVYIDPEYSDLKIESRSTVYKVHKVLVCPRSEYFAKECRIGSAQDGVLSLKEDDPRAIEMIVRFFYYLDYYTDREEEISQLNGHNNGDHLKEEATNGVSIHANGVSDSNDTAADIAPSTPTAEPASLDSFDDFLPISPVKAKNKKKKRKKSMAQPQVDPESLATGEPDGPAPAVQEPPSKPDTSRRWSDMVEDAIEEEQLGTPSVETDLVLHARVYALSRKYGIEPLQVLALERFKTDAEKEWASHDFLQAAKEVYTSPDGDRKIKDVITTIVYEHPGLLDKPENQSVIEGLSLSYDLVMHMRKQGKF